MPPFAAADEEGVVEDETGRQQYTQSQLAAWLAQAEENAGVFAARVPGAADNAMILKVLLALWRNKRP